MNDFEHQLSQMLPVIRDKEPKPKIRQQPLAMILLGFLLGVGATYNFMQPNDSAWETQPQESFMLVFDDTNLEHLRRPADVFTSVVRVPVLKVAVPSLVGDQTQWQYGTMRNELRRM